MLIRAMNLAFTLFLISCSNAKEFIHKIKVDNAEFEVIPISSKEDRKSDFSKFLPLIGQGKNILYIYKNPRYINLFCLSPFKQSYQIVFIDADLVIRHAESISPGSTSTSTSGLTSKYEVVYALIADSTEKSWKSLTEGAKLSFSDSLKKIEPVGMPYAKVGDRKFDLEIASSPADSSRGLMYRKNLSRNDGMLFIFKHERDQGFWMKNTLIPLTICFINGNFEVNSVYNMMPYQDPFNETNPKTYRPNRPYLYALEVNLGEIDLNYIGRKIELHLE